MRRACLVLLLVAAGCGDPPGEPGEPSALDDAPDVAVDEVMAASELVEGEDMIMLGAPATGRSELAAVLRRLRAEAPCDAAPRVEKLMSSTRCPFIDRDGEYISDLTVTFTACRIRSGAVIDGTVRVQVSKALAAGAACDRETVVVDIDHTLTFNARVATPEGSVLEIGGAGTAHFQRGRGVTPGREVTVQQRRRRLSSGGRLLGGQELSGRASSRLDASTSSLLVDGSFTSHVQPLAITVSTTMTDVRRVATCCHPVGGQLEARVSGRGRADSTRLVEYGPGCGEARVDGQARPLPACL